MRKDSKSQSPRHVRLSVKASFLFENSKRKRWQAIIRRARDDMNDYQLKAPTHKGRKKEGVSHDGRL